MTETLQAIAATLIVCTTALVIMCKLAPLGHQDADGFHAGEPPAHTDFDGD